MATKKKGEACALLKMDRVQRSCELGILRLQLACLGTNMLQFVAQQTVHFHSCALCTIFLVHV